LILQEVGNFRVEKITLQIKGVHFMRQVVESSITEVELHLEKTNSNIFFDYNDYGLKDFPKNEFKCFKVILEKSDIDRLYLIGNFANITKDSLKVSDLVSKEEVLCDTHENRGERVKKIMEGGAQYNKGLDLLTDKDFELVLVGQNLIDGPLVLMDGSHRIIAHYLNRGDVDRVHAYVCIHSNVKKWGMHP
jgi:hypothetical protein